MDNDEVLAVLDIMRQADGECYYCARELFEMFILRFPEHRQIALDYYQTATGIHAVWCDEPRLDGHHLEIND